MAEKPKGAATTASTQTTTATATELPKADPMLTMLGDASYSVVAGNVKLYPDQRKAGVKNGRAGHVSFTMGRWTINASVYMDVETNGGTERRTYRLSFPKSVSASFADDREAARFKVTHLRAWSAARTAKTATEDAGTSDATISETIGE